MKKSFAGLLGLMLVALFATTATAAVPSAVVSGMALIDVAPSNLESCDVNDSDSFAECPNDPTCEDLNPGNCVTNVASCTTINTGANVVCNGSPWCAAGSTIHVTTCQCADAPGGSCDQLASQVRSCQ